MFIFSYGPVLARCLCNVSNRVKDLATEPSRISLKLCRQHNIIPDSKLVSSVTHVALAFMQSSKFNEALTPSEWPLFTTVEEVRQRFSKGTSVMVAIGGWGDTQGFSAAAASDEGRILFARNVKAMVDFTGADGKLSPQFSTI